MPIFRTDKKDNFVVMSNVFLRDKTLSIKAKGLLAYMLSLPDDWKFTIAGLTSQLKECKSSIGGMISELEQHGYVKRNYPRSADGKILEAIYEVYEVPPE